MSLFFHYFNLLTYFIGANISKLFFDLISLRYNDSLKHPDNPDSFPFELTTHDFNTIKLAMNKSRQFVPTKAFSGSSKDCANVRSLYRSCDWIDFFIHAVPCLVVPLFKRKDVQEAVVALCRACGLAIQWRMTCDDIDEIEE
jgi:hypothetical protein